MAQERCVIRGTPRDRAAAAKVPGQPQRWTATPQLRL